jgi:phenylpropionate dioxygenase-like ring-hydroxylating dioxygenase large terminal subunit
MPDAAENRDAHAHPELPPLGIRNYWYPALATWRLGKRPRAVKLLGEDVVLFRDGGKVYALHNRCLHRGARLSLGKCLYPGSGTISCPYHGWTYKGETGRCVAKLVEGPDTRIPDKARLRTYPVRECAGVLWIFVGDMDAVPLEEDLPEYIWKRDEWHSISNWRTYHCNWRLLADNLAHDQHAPFLHRTSPELRFQPVFPFATRNLAVELDDGKGIGHVARDGITSAEYPGLGRFPPPSEWYRMLKPMGRGKDMDLSKAPAVIKYGIKYRHMSRLPSVTLIGRPSGDFFTCRWITPIDEKTTLLYSFNLYRRRGWLQGFADRVVWFFWMSWAHDWLFSDQDKWIVESVVAGEEMLSRTDVGVTAWRRYAATHARRPPARSAAEPAMSSASTVQSVTESAA